MADEKRSDNISIDIEDKKDSSRPEETKEAMSGITSNPIIAVVSYCASSILMTTTNKYVMSGVDFNLSFFLLCVQVRRLFQRRHRDALTLSSPWCASLRLSRASG
jgi:GDP-mannose transporter